MHASLSCLIYEMELEPPAKWLRTAICLCSKCNGQERDCRTVDRYMKVFESQLPIPVDSSSSSSLPQLSLDPPDLTPESSELLLDLTSTEPTPNGNRSEPLQSGSSSASFEISVNERQIQKFVLKEVKLKLDHGHSIAATEEHLEMLLSYWVMAESPQNGTQ